MTGGNPTLRVKLTKVRILLTDFTGTAGPDRRNRADQRLKFSSMLQAYREAGSGSSSTRRARAQCSAPMATSSATLSDEAFAGFILCGRRQFRLSAPAPRFFHRQRRADARDPRSAPAPGALPGDLRAARAEGRRFRSTFPISGFTTSAMSSRCSRTSSPTCTTAGAAVRCSIAKPRRPARSYATLWSSAAWRGSSRAWSRSTPSKTMRRTNRRDSSRSLRAGPGSGSRSRRAAVRNRVVHGRRVRRRSADRSRSPALAAPRADHRDVHDERWNARRPAPTTRR